MKTRSASNEVVTTARGHSRDLKTHGKTRGIKDLLMPDFLVLCEDYVRGAGNNISIIKTVDLLRPPQLPYTPDRLVVVATFFRMPNVPISEFAELSPELRLIVQTPTKKQVEIGPFAVSKISEKDPWIIERLIVDLSGSIEFTSSGPYTVRVEGRTKDSDFEPTHWRLLPIGPPANSSKTVTRI